MASGIRGCFTLGGFLIELTPDGSTPRFPSCVLLFFGLDARESLSCRGLSCGFLAFGLQSCSLAAICFLTSSLLTQRFQLRRCESRGFLAFNLQSLGLDACCFFLTCGLLTLRLELCRCESRCFLSFSL